MKSKVIAIIFAGLPFLNVEAMSCQRYFHHTFVKDNGVHVSLQPTLENLSQVISQLQGLREKISTEADVYKSELTVSRFLSGTVLSETLRESFEELITVIANVDFDVIGVQDLVYEHLLVEEAYRYQMELEGITNHTTLQRSLGDREVRMVSPDRFYLNSLYKLYVNEIYAIIHSYLKVSTIPKDVKLDRIEFLLRADIRYLGLDKKEKEQFISEILFFGVQGSDPKLTADRFFLNRR